MKNKISFFKKYFFCVALLFSQVTIALPIPPIETVAHWAVAGGIPFIQSSLALLWAKHEKLADLCNVGYIECSNTELVTFMKSVLDEIGLNAQEISIKKWKSNTGTLGVMHNNLIVINERFCLLLSKEELRGVLAHEAAHIINNDVNKRIYAGMLLTPLIHLGCRCAAYVGKLPYSLSPSTGLFEFLINRLLLLIYARFQEKNADLTVAKLLPDAIPGLIKSFANLHVIHDGNDYFDITHPLFSTRIAYLKEALKKLQKKE
ncbi:MAG: M48 family metalloprotease [Candidatus Babeliaceae bacterium]